MEATGTEISLAQEPWDYSVIRVESIFRGSWLIRIHGLHMLTF
jgi:hypothetical protein